MPMQDPTLKASEKVVGTMPMSAMATGVATAEDPAVTAELLVPPLPTGHEGLGFDIMSSQSLVDFLMDVTP